MSIIQVTSGPTSTLLCSMCICYRYHVILVDNLRVQICLLIRIISWHTIALQLILDQLPWCVQPTHLLEHRTGWPQRSFWPWMRVSMMEKQISGPWASPVQNLVCVPPRKNTVDFCYYVDGLLRYIGHYVILVYRLYWLLHFIGYYVGNSKHRTIS